LIVMIEAAENPSPPPPAAAGVDSPERGRVE
jgi:hypothetical protein